MLHANRRDVLAGSASLTMMLASPLRAMATSGQSYLFSYFTDEDQAAGLRLAASTDGFTFEALRGGDVFLKPVVGESGLMRDPCLFRAPGSEAPFHLVWTTSWTGRTIGHASSRDLIHWSPQTAIPVMAAFPHTRYTWAPEGFWDATRKHFILYWSSSVEGMFSDASGRTEDGQTPRIFYTTTRDFRHFSPTRLLFDPGFSVIDASFLPGPSGSLLLLYKEERLEPLTKNIRVASAQSVTGPFTINPNPISGGWVEGPTGIWTGSEYRVYADAYRKKEMQLFRSKDLTVWEESTISMPKGMKHGTIIRVPDPLIAGLR